ncbi:nicotinamide-nucleotide amidohydrolase family protein [bacterium]|nr:nicotinamide-nucleotide amidohydrolase family protein [bacterium]
MRPRRKTGLGMLAIGNEVAEGRVANENGRWLARRLGPALTVTARDDAAEVISALRYLNRCRTVIVSGGLGPTADDLTRDFVCRWIRCGLATHAPTLGKITRKMRRLGRPTPNNMAQALYPAAARPLANRTGGAVGFRCVRNGTAYYFLPGVPSEFQEMVEAHVRAGPGNAARIYRFWGIPESTVDSILQNRLPASLKTRYGIYPSVQGVQVILRHPASALRMRFDRVVRAHLGKWLVSESSRTPEKILVDVMSKRRLKLAAAESCSAGMFCATMAGVPGASRVLLGGLCAYDNRIKMSELGVAAKTLIRHGAVSVESAREMASGVLRKFKSDVAVAITGIAGPAGGTPDKPVGTVHFGFAFARRTGVRPTLRTEKAFFTGGRQAIREKSVYCAIWKLVNLLSVPGR